MYFVSICIYIYVCIKCPLMHFLSIASFASIYVACHVGMFNSKGGRVGSSHGFWGERWLDHSPHRQGDGLFSPRVGSRCLAFSDAKLSHRLWDRWYWWWCWWSWWGEEEEQEEEEQEEENNDPRLTIWTVPEVPVAFKVAPPMAAQALATRKFRPLRQTWSVNSQPRKAGM